MKNMSALRGITESDEFGPVRYPTYGFDRLYAGIEEEFSGRTHFLFPESWVIRSRMDRVSRFVESVFSEEARKNPRKITEYYRVSKRENGEIVVVRIPGGTVVFRIDSRGLNHEGSVPLCFIDRFVSRKSGK